MDMDTRIKEAIKKAEASYNEKKEKSRSIDEKAKISDEDINRIISTDINNLTNDEKHSYLLNLSQWLDLNCFQVASVSKDKTAIMIEFSRLSSISGKDLEVFNKMCSLSSQLFMSGIKDDVIKFSFVV